MANQIIIPYCLPVRFYKLDQQQLPQYLTRHFDYFVDSAQRKEWETQVTYNQKWQTSDATKFQFESNFSAIQVDLITCDGTIIVPQAATPVRANIYVPGFYIYENTFSYASVPPGTYYYRMTLGGSEVYISNPQQVAEEWPGTMLFEYKNSRYFGNVVYETGITFGFRCEAFLTRLNPGNERTAYNDQRMNPTILKSVPFRQWTLEIGKKSGGVPDWVMDIMNWIWSHDYVTADGVLLAVSDGANFEATEIDKVYPYQQWSLSVQDGINQTGLFINPVLDSNKRIIIAGMVDATLFGDLSENAGSNLVPINNVN